MTKKTRSQKNAPTKNRLSQMSRIIARCIKADGGWVSLGVLARVSGALAVATRVSNANKMWERNGIHFRIQNRIDHKPGGVQKSWYRFETGEFA